MGLRTFDCARCRALRQTAEEGGVATPRPEDEDEIAVRCAEALSTLSDVELAIILRTAAGFTERDVKETYAPIDGIERLMKRLVARLTRN